MEPIPDNANEGCVGPSSSSAGHASSCAGCPNQSLCASGAGREVDPAIAEVAQRLSQVRHKILVLSGKGGVGKSSISTQLAWSLACRGYQVGILDIDICGPSVPRMTGVENEEVRRSSAGWVPVFASENLSVMSVAFMLKSRNDAVIWRGPRKNGLIKQFLTEVCWGELDFLIVDSPPGTSDEHISIAQYLQAANIDGSLIVTTPQEVALLDVRKEISFCRKVNLPIIGVVENMTGFICPCCKTESEIFPAVTGGANQLGVDMSVEVLGSIPLDPLLLRSCEAGECFTAKHPDRPAAQRFNQLVDRLLDSSESLRKTREEFKLNQTHEQ